MYDNDILTHPRAGFYRKGNTGICDVTEILSVAYDRITSSAISFDT
jgi:hypothetical protein